MSEENTKTIKILKTPFFQTSEKGEKKKKFKIQRASIKRKN